MVLPTKSSRHIVIAKGNTSSKNIVLAESSTPPTDITETNGARVCTGVDSSDTPDVNSKPFPLNLPEKIGLTHGQNSKAYVVINNAGNIRAHEVGSKKANNLIRQIYATEEGKILRRSALNEVNEYLQDYAEMALKKENIWYRVAPIQNGIEIDLGDDGHTNIQVLPSQVIITNNNSQVLFNRPPNMRPFESPYSQGDLSLINKYLNLSDADTLLIIAWLSYTLAHPKYPSSNYVHLILGGDQGSGKTTMCRFIQELLDPSTIGVQSFPTNPKDLGIAAEQSHVLFYDNMRSIKQSMADSLCIASTGGNMTTRQLYTNDGMHALNLHCPVVMNSLHPIINQPDLAQRSLPLTLKRITGSNRKAESELVKKFHEDLPMIFRGLLDLISNIFTHLPATEPTNPERMYDFSHWLAAMEKVNAMPCGVYQSAYSHVLQDAMLDSLLDNPLAEAIIAFADNMDASTWSDTPSRLLTELNMSIDIRTQRSSDWPSNAISLSKRLISMKGGLLSQGIEVIFTRGKNRQITITRMEDF